MLKNLKRDEKGFTIIEVLIVLAIAGLIMLIVFLAVPALQRNSRNTQRNNDASLIASAVNECLSNRNGQVASCDTTGEINAFLDAARLSQLNVVTVNTGAATAPGTAATITNEARIYYQNRCNADGSTAAGGLARDYVVLFRVEGSGSTLTRCVSS